MKRRAFVAGMAAMMITLLATEAQETSKVARIGVLLTHYPSHADDPPQAFRKRLREFGHIERQNIVIEGRQARPDSEELSRETVELIRFKSS
jgi:hypothetical protein